MYAKLLTSYVQLLIEKETVSHATKTTVWQKQDSVFSTLKVISV